ncbi:hypothetical protein GQ600_18660 [Phytophthora cactorum]|nr:hypothetical protein GQ600_18660 [Phytophthora cactorum]
MVLICNLVSSKLRHSLIRRVRSKETNKMGLQEKINANPTVYAVATPTRKKFDVDEALDEDVADPFEADEVFGASARQATSYVLWSPLFQRSRDLNWTANAKHAANTNTRLIAVGVALSCTQLVMTERRRKRKTTNSFADDTVTDFNAVDPTQARRQSDCSERESRIRQESWMSKVSLAMSTRIFSGGKKLNGSRSTQVTPVGSVQSDNSRTSEGRTSSSSLQEAELPQTISSPFTGQPTLRQVASERALGSSTNLPSTSSVVSTFGSCPSVTCDVALDDSDDSLPDRSRWSSNGSGHRRGDSQRSSNGRRQFPTTVVQKVRPRDHGHESDDEEDVMIKSTRTKVTTIATYPRSSCCEDTDSEINVQDAAPILKGFFSKTVSVSKEQRQQQRQQKREALYRESKQRQDKLREQTECERVANDESMRKRKVEQLRRLNQQRRMELLRDAASARKDLLERIQDDKGMYQTERERWENDFEDEMRVLSAAFRKTRTSDDNRPMTAAGLAVPEALSQLERDASNFEKRVKTAQPALASIPPRQRSTERPSTGGVTTNIVDQHQSPSPLFEFCEVLTLEDSKEVFDLFGNDDHANDLFPPKNGNDRKPPNIDINHLLDEREQLLERLVAVNRMIQSQQQLQ